MEIRLYLVVFFRIVLGGGYQRLIWEMEACSVQESISSVTSRGGVLTLGLTMAKKYSRDDGLLIGIVIHPKREP